MNITIKQQKISSSKRKGKFANAILEGTKGQNYSQQSISEFSNPKLHDTAGTYYHKNVFILVATVPGPSPAYVVNYILKENTSGRSKVFSTDFDDLYEECSQTNWDGYGAKPVYKSLRRKVEKFLDALPNNIPDPEISPNPDGEISLDWCYKKDKLFSLSIGLKKIVYAFIDGPRRSRGIEIYKTIIPESIILHLNNFLSNNS